MNGKNVGRHRLTVRIDEKLVAKAKAKAALEHTTISEQVRVCLERWTRDFPYQTRFPIDDAKDKE